MNHSIEYTPTKLTSQREAIVQTAYQFLHAPYLWGGKTPLGIDCSGLTQMVYKIHGIPLKRDAYQQAKQGKEIILTCAKKGDLAFFGENKITHVGIIINKNEIIHAFGSVRIDKINKKGILNRAKSAQVNYFGEAIGEVPWHVVKITAQKSLKPG